MRMRSLLSIPLLLTLTACGGQATAGDGDAAMDTRGASAQTSAADIDCPPLQVTIDGAPVEGLDHALAFSEAKTGPGTGGFGVEVFNHGEASCEDVLARSRSAPKGEINVRAFTTEGSSNGSVAVGSKTNFGQGVELVQKPESEGDLLAICVSGAKWTSGGPGGAGPTYEISGLFAASYCGER